MSAYDALRFPRQFYHVVEVLRHQLKAAVRFAELNRLGFGLFALRTLFFDQFVVLVVLTLQQRKALFRLDRIGTFVFFFLVVIRLRLFHPIGAHLCGCGHMIRWIQITHQ